MERHGAYIQSFVMFCKIYFIMSFWALNCLCCEYICSRPFVRLPKTISFIICKKTQAF